jgi:GNAT superfamily N-acetyltransferase
MRAKYYRVSRLVVLPDYQGIGVGKRLLNFVAELYASQTKLPFYLLTSNPQIIRGKHGELENKQIWARKQGKRQHKNKQWNTN